MMEKIQRLKQDVAQLSYNELVIFRNWFDEFDAQKWDKQIEEDVAAGRLDELADKAIADFKAGYY